MNDRRELTQIWCYLIETNRIRYDSRNAVGALDAFCQINGLDKPMFEYKMVKSSVAAMFQCDCKVNNVMLSGMCPHHSA